MAERGREVLEGFHSHSLAAGDLLHLISWTFDQRPKFSVLLEVYWSGLHLHLRSSLTTPTSTIQRCTAPLLHSLLQWVLLTCSSVNAMTVSCGSYGWWLHLRLLRRYKNVWCPLLVKFICPTREDALIHLITEQFTKLVSPVRQAVII